MASQKINSIEVQPKDLSISWGLDSTHWRLPNESDPTAELKRVSFLRVIGRVPINPLKKNDVHVYFEVRKTNDSKGWDKSNVKMGVKVGESSVTEDGKYSLKDVNSQLQQAKVGVRFLIHENFQLENNPSANDKYLYFGLFDEPLNEKFGLIIYEATVEIVEIVEAN